MAPDEEFFLEKPILSRIRAAKRFMDSVNWRTNPTHIAEKVKEAYQPPKEPPKPLDPKDPKAFRWDRK